MSSRRENLIQGTLVVVLLLAMIGVGGLLWMRVLPAHDPEVTRDQYLLTSGHTRLVIALVSANCPQCRSPDFPQTLAGIEELVRSRAAEDSMVTRLIGIAVDWSVDNGLKYLESVGPWDEVNVGQSWLALGVSRFVWDDHIGPPTIPQVILVDREIVANDDGIRTINEQVEERIIGLDEMKEWLEKHRGSALLKGPEL